MAFAQSNNDDIPIESGKTDWGTYKNCTSMNCVDTESMYSDTAPKIRESDFRRRQDPKGWTLLRLAYQATGVIYGDIGTSPLYVFSSTFTSNPSRDDILGAVSLIIWTLTLIVSVKYAWIVLHADDEGEGGIFAVYTLLARYCNIVKREQSLNYLVKMERHATDSLPRSNQGIRRWLEQSKIAHAILKLLGVLGVRFLLADGVLTPAQSVLGAIQGLEVAVPNISSGTIVGVSCAILVVLFILQPLGIHRISSVWAPIVVIWLLFNAAFGIYNLAVHDYTILKAFSPYFAGDWFVRNKTSGWISLGGILLAFTGVETLFADMGAFSRSAIRISWFSLAYPCLLLAYIGQGAYLLDDPSAYSNPFFKTVPPGTFYPSLVFAILAAIVASQATITGCFQLLAQTMSSSYFPHLELKHTSNTFHGQIYIPIANWLLMIGTVIVTAVYNNTTRIGQAYGACVVLVTFITTQLVALVAIVVWRMHPALVFPVWLVFATLDGLYLSSALVKVPNGAWFTLMLAAILASFLTLWRYGKEMQWASEANDPRPLSNLFAKSPNSDQLILAEKYGGSNIVAMDGFGIFFDKTGMSIPEVYLQWLTKFHAQTDIVILLHMRSLSMPFVNEDERFEVIKTSIPNVYRVVFRHGYNEHVITPRLAQVAYEEVRKVVISSISETSAVTTVRQNDDLGIQQKSATNPTNTSVAHRLSMLDRAFTSQPLYVSGKQHLRVSPRHNIVKRIILDAFLWVRDNTRSRIERWNVPVETLIEIGFVREL